MKTYFYPLFLSLFFSFANCFADQNNNDSLSQVALSQKLRQQPQVPSGTSSDWFAEAMHSIQKREYQFNKFEDQNHFSAFNRKQNLAFVVSGKGYEVKKFNPGNVEEFNWHVDFKLQSIARSNGNKIISDNSIISFDDNHLSYTSSSLKIEYLNNEEGLRQNFIVKNKPEGNGHLEVVIDANTDLRLQQINNNKIIFCKNNDKKSTQLIYEDLKVWDAEHRQLNARMELRNDTEIALIVDDANAKYPVTIDPLNKTPDWQASGNGLLFPLLNDLTAQVLYGFSVSGAGDVNGDGIDDIIIGAPAFVQIVSVSGGTFNSVAVGAAFLYYGHRPGGPVNKP